MSDKKRKPSLFTWTMVFLANLVVPFGFGLMLPGTRVTDPEIIMRIVGMLLGISILWIGGVAIAIRSPRLGRALITGGIFVGVSQIFPVVHMIVGSVAVHIAGAIPQNRHSDSPTLLEMMNATLLTGAPLMVLALGIGVFYHPVRDDFDEPANH